MDRTNEIQEIQLLAQDYGIHFAMEQFGYIPPNLAANADLAMDALPTLITAGNSGIPAFLTNWVSPSVIEVLLTPNMGSQIIGEMKMGDWVTPTAFFPVAESTGEVSSYGDYSPNGEIGANINWPQRQSYGFQCVAQWGDKMLAQMAKGKINWANRQQIAAAKVMDKFQNLSYFFGVQGLQNYGLLNDPALPVALSPSTKTAGGTRWVNTNGSQNATALEVLGDIGTLVSNAILSSGGNINTKSKGKLCMSPFISIAMTYLTQYNVSVAESLKKIYPGLEVVTAVEYNTASGQLAQVIFDEADGQEVGSCAFTEKMRGHGVVRDLSAFKEKKSGGTWGAVIYMPILIQQMLGL